MNINESAQEAGERVWAGLRPDTLTLRGRRLLQDGKGGVEATVSRFLEKLTPPNERGCIEWVAAHRKRGYGAIGLLGKNWGSHRLAFYLWRTDEIDGLHLCHRCDNPPCVNPEHLFIGTQTDNMRDCFEKGRGRTPNLCGERIHSAKLTASQAMDIYKAEGTQQKIAEIYGITRELVSIIKLKKGWKHIHNPANQIIATP